MVIISIISLMTFSSAAYYHFYKMYINEQ